MKIAEKLAQAAEKGQTVFSYEFFPPRTEEVCATSVQCSCPLI